MGRKLCLFCALVPALVVLTGCASTSNLNKANTRVDTLEKKLGGVQDSLAALRSDVEVSREAMSKRLEKAEADALTASKQLPTVREEIAKFGAQFEQMNATIAEAQGLIVKNLENAREIYRTQFLALEEVLQNLKRPAEAE